MALLAWRAAADQALIFGPRARSQALARAERAAWMRLQHAVRLWADRCRLARVRTCSSRRHTLRRGITAWRASLHLSSAPRLRALAGLRMRRAPPLELDAFWRCARFAQPSHRPPSSPYPPDLVGRWVGVCNERRLDAQLLQRAQHAPLQPAWSRWRDATSTATTARSFEAAAGCQAALSIWSACARRTLFASAAYDVAAGHHGLVARHLAFAGWLSALLVIARRLAISQLGARQYVVQHMQCAFRRWSYRAMATKVLRAQQEKHREDGLPGRVEQHRFTPSLQAGVPPR